MRGHYVGRTWQHDPSLYAPPRYRRACSYKAFVPDELVGLQVGARELARAEANEASGRSIGTEAREIIANIDAMQFAIEEASSHPELTIDAIVEIHRVLMARASNSNIAGRVREQQNWIGGNDYNPCGAASVQPPPE